jgi:hypothetical protein
MSGFGSLLIVLDSCESGTMVQSISTGDSTFHKAGFERGIVGDKATEQADTKRQ